jgi:DNA-directed RNA polymerase specialized sigma subunit
MAISYPLCESPRAPYNLRIMKQDTKIIGGVSINIPSAIKKFKSSGKSSGLTERHQAIFEYKFGIKDGIQKTDKEVGEKFGISNSRVRQLSAYVLYKIGSLA